MFQKQLIMPVIPSKQIQIDFQDPDTFDFPCLAINNPSYFQLAYTCSLEVDNSSANPNVSMTSNGLFSMVGSFISSARTNSDAIWSVIQKVGTLLPSYLETAASTAGTLGQAAALFIPSISPALLALSTGLDQLAQITRFIGPVITNGAAITQWNARLNGDHLQALDNEDKIRTLSAQCPEAAFLFYKHGDFISPLVKSASDKKLMVELLFKHCRNPSPDLDKQINSLVRDTAVKIGFIQDLINEKSEDDDEDAFEDDHEGREENCDTHEPKGTVASSDRSAPREHTKKKRAY
jgi:hypothetical protein